MTLSPPVYGRRTVFTTTYDPGSLSCLSVPLISVFQDSLFAPLQMHGSFTHRRSLQVFILLQSSSTTKAEEGGGGALEVSRRSERGGGWRESLNRGGKLGRRRGGADHDGGGGWRREQLYGDTREQSRIYSVVGQRYKTTADTVRERGGGLDEKPQVRRGGRREGGGTERKEVD